MMAAPLWYVGSCVPNIRSAAGQRFYNVWGKSQLDAGCKALYWGEARMIGGSDVNNSAKVPNSCVLIYESRESRVESPESCMATIVQLVDLATP